MTHDKKQTALELWNKLSIVYDKYKKIQANQMFEENLTAPQFGVLEILNRTGPTPLRKISTEMMVTGANITCVMDNLEKIGLVQRINSKMDRRIINAEITLSGKNKIDSILPKYSENISAFTSVLNETEQKELLRILNKF